MDQAGIAIHNARLAESLRKNQIFLEQTNLQLQKSLEKLIETNLKLDRKVKELETLYDVSRSLNMTTDMESVLSLIINKSRHEASHVNIKSNRRWLALFADCGLGLEVAATWRGRRRYLAQSAGTECWHMNLLALSRRRHTALRRIVTRVAGDGTLAWWVAGRMGFLWR